MASAREKARERAVIVRMRSRWEHGLGRRVRKIFGRQARDLPGAYKKGGLGDIGVRIVRDADQLLSTLEAFYVSAGVSTARFRLAKFNTPPTFIDERVLSFAEQFGAERVVKINSTQQNIAARVVREGIAAGDSTQEIAKRLSRTIPPTYRNRALTIARTEIGFATSAADRLAIEETGLQMEKEWLTANDGGSRHPSAFGLHGQRRPLDAFFDVRGWPMAHPHDRIGPAGEVINCRCSLSYEPVTT